MEYRKLKQLPANTVKTGCVFCQASNDFSLYGKKLGDKRFLYFECSNCGGVLQLRTK